MELRHSASHRATILPSLAFLKLAMILCRAFFKVEACLDREREAFHTFRKVLRDPSHLLSSWDQGDDCCKWRGVSCNNDTGYLMKLDLHADVDSSFLSGRIDPALLELKYLQVLDLSCNYLSGSSIPSFLGSMKELQHLNLSGGRFSGRIEPALLQMKHLQVLDLSDNDFSGSSVPSLGSMKELRHLNLSWTGLSGRIPHQLGNFSNLVSLQLQLKSDGFLSADILGWLRNMTSLEYQDMSNGNLSLASHHWVHVIMNCCPSLIELRLRQCQQRHFIIGDYIPQ